MKVLGITGGVGSGKSMVVDYITRTFRVRAIQADLVAHALMEPGGDCYERIAAYFGKEILKSDLTIDRKKLGAVVFADREKLKKLNSLVHPRVKEFIAAEIRKERYAGKTSLLVIEAALLIEDHYEVFCDEIWYVYAKKEVRQRRLVSMRGYSKEKVEQIMKNQLSDEEYRKYCHFIVDNSSDIVENTFKQIDKGLVEHGLL